MKTATLLLTGFLLTIFLLSGITGCKKESKQESPAPVDDSVVIPATTKVFSTQDWAGSFVSYDSASQVFTFNSGSAIVDDLAVGDVIVSTYGEGFLRKITQISSSGGNRTITTVPAVMTEALTKGNLRINQALSYSKIKSVRTYVKGVTVKSAGSGKLPDDGIQFPIDVVLYDDDGNLSTTDDQLTLEGEFNMTPSIQALINFQPFPPHVESLDISYTLAESLELSNTINLVSFNWDDEITLASLEFQPIIVFVGTLPVVIIPEVSLLAGASVDIESNIHTAIEQNYDYTVGVKYESGVWSAYQNTNKSFTFTPPTLTASATAQAYLKPELSFKFYGIVAPYFNAKLFGEIDADVQTTPWWILYAGLGANIGVRAEVFGLSFEYDKEILSIKERIAEAPSNGAPGKPSNPYPPNGSTNQSVTNTLSWTCTDPEMDPLTFDIFFGTANPPSLAQQGLTTASYTPVYLANNTTYYWYVRAHDDNGNSTDGDVWSFTTVDQNPGDPCNGITQLTCQGQVYHTVSIGNQCWFKENLNFQTGNSWCYNGSSANCALYGRLYDFPTASSACPAGWHLASDNEWKALEIFLGMPVAEADLTGYRGTDQGTQLKLGGSSGFNALMAGTYNLGFYSDLGVNGYYWTSSLVTPTNSWARIFNDSNPKISRYESLSQNGFSVRCIKD